VTRDDKIGKIGPVPSGCGANPGVPSDEVVGVEIRPYFVLALYSGVSTILGLQPHLHPVDGDLSSGTPGLAEFSLATPSAWVV